jgi:predicted transcriptional regulator of viral defense system
VLLAGKSTNRLEVFDTQFPGEQATYPTTSLERTLIDCTVRPSHAGGVDELPGMYAAAKERVSVRRLSKVLDDLNFIYPYQQAIGFLMERAGYAESQLSLFEQQPFALDFYLDYAMQGVDYSSRWRLYFPKGF